MTLKVSESSCILEANHIDNISDDDTHIEQQCISILSDSEAQTIVSCSRHTHGGM